MEIEYCPECKRLGYDIERQSVKAYRGYDTLCSFHLWKMFVHEKIYDGTFRQYLDGMESSFHITYPLLPEVVWDLI